METPKKSGTFFTLFTAFSAVIGIMGLFADFYPDCYVQAQWFGVAAALAIPGLFSSRWKIKVPSILLLIFFACLSYLSAQDTAMRLSGKNAGKSPYISEADKQFEFMNPAEQKLCRQTLWQITSKSTTADVINLLGTPSRDLGLKKNWWVKAGGKNDRIGVYFDLSGHATAVVLDGGIGRFYYRRKVTDHEKVDFK